MNALPTTAVLMSLFAPIGAANPGVESPPQVTAPQEEPSPAPARDFGPYRDPPDAVRSHLRQAREAADRGRIDAALEHVEAGLRHEGSGSRSAYDKARLETWAVEWREREVLSLLEAGEPRAAGVLMERMSAPLDSDFAAGHLERLRERVEAAEREARARVDAQLQRRIAGIERDLERADRYLARAQRESRRTVYSARRGEAAAHYYREAEEAAAQALDGAALDDPSTERLLALRHRASDGALRAMLRIANARTTQGDYRGALEWVDRVAVLAPDNEQARELRRTIQIASSVPVGWLGWGPMMPLGVPAGR